MKRLFDDAEADSLKVGLVYKDRSGQLQPTPITPKNRHVILERMVSLAQQYDPSAGIDMIRRECLQVMAGYEKMYREGRGIPE